MTKRCKHNWNKEVLFQKEGFPSLRQCAACSALGRLEKLKIVIVSCVNCKAPATRLNNAKPHRPVCEEHAKVLVP